MKLYDLQKVRHLLLFSCDSINLSDFMGLSFGTVLLQWAGTAFQRKILIMSKGEGILSGKIVHAQKHLC